MVQAIIIDDEQHCIDRLLYLLQEYCKYEVEITGTFTMIDAAVAALKTTQPALVFLDVQLSAEATGFDLLQQLPAINFDVIFTTAFDKYAVQAFKFSAIDYLLKPIDADDFKQAMHKVKEKAVVRETQAQMKTLFHNIRTQQNAAKRICVPTLNSLLYLQVSDIIRCEAAINYTFIYLKDKRKITVAKTLKEFEELLMDCRFFRVHSAHLLNLAYVTSYNKGKGGIAVMIDKTEVEVATRRKEAFLKALGEV